MTIIDCSMLRSLCTRGGEPFDILTNFRARKETGRPSLPFTTQREFHWTLFVLGDGDYGTDDFVPYQW
jgi:hypothetical protein